MKKIYVLLLFVLTFVLTACNFKFEMQDITEYGLESVSSKDELIKLIKSSSQNYSYTDGGVDVIVEDYASAPNDSSKHTTTNTQVAGVDESDIVKTDGDRIFYMNYNNFYVIKLLGDGKMEKIFHKKLSSQVSVSTTDTYFQDMYITDDYLVLIGNRYSFTKLYLESDDAFPSLIYPRYLLFKDMTVIFVYDKETLELVDEYEVSGRLNSSRLINNKLYVISSHSLYYYKDYEDYDYRPYYKHKGELTYFEYEDIKFIKDIDHNSYTIITTVSLDKKISYENNIYLSPASWGVIYVSLEGIYFATTIHRRVSFFQYDTKGFIFSYQFDKTTGKVYYGGCGEYDGTVLNQFAIDEHNGYLRMFTTETTNKGVINRLYIFKRVLEDNSYKLKVASLIDSGIGKPGERIQSVRFNQDIATVVTFVRTDPFYTIDLSDPYKPKILGELEMPGFSTYQHPWTDNYIIGIGYETDDRGRVNGLKFSLYDITNKNNPVEVGTPLILLYDTYGFIDSDSIFNHKSIMVDKENNLLGIPIRISLYQSQLKYVFSYMLLDIDPTKAQPISIKQTFDHLPSELAYNGYNYYGYYEYLIERGLRIDNHLYLLSQKSITSHQIENDYKLTQKINFSS